MSDYNVITLEKLKGDQRDIAEIIGIENYRLFIKHFGGGSMYIPLATTIMKNKRNREIIQEFDGGNYSALAKKHGVSVKTVQRVINGSRGINRD